MAGFGEPLDWTRRREEEAKDVFTTLQFSNPDQNMEVDMYGFRELNTPPSQFSQSALSLANYAYIPEPTPEAPDVAPNVEGWTPTSMGVNPLDPYGIRAPYRGAPADAYAASSSPRETLRNVAGVFNPLTENSIFGSFYQGENPVLQELARPSNYVGAGSIRGFAQAALANIAGRMAGEVAMEMLPENANPILRGAVGLGAGLAGGVAGYRSIDDIPRAIRAADAAINPANLRGVAPEAFQVGRASGEGRVPFYGGTRPGEVPVPLARPSMLGAAENITEAARTTGGIPSGETTAVARPFIDRNSPTGILNETFGIEMPERFRPLTSYERFRNNINKRFNRQAIYEESATPIGEMHERAYATSRNVAATVSDQVNAIAKSAFKFNNNQQIQELAGVVNGWPNGPTMQDLIENLPKFERFLNPAQRKAVDDINNVMRPYNEAARALNPALEKSLRLPEGANYSHHAYSMTQPEMVRTGSSVGGKESYEQLRKTRTMEEAIRAGRTPKPFAEATRDYIRMVGESAADRMLAEQSKASLGGQTAAERIAPGLRNRWEKVNNRIRSARQTLAGQEVRISAQAGEARRSRQEASRAVGRLAKSSVQRGELRAAAAVTPEDMQMARSAVQDSVRESQRVAREIGQNAQRITEAGGRLTASEQAILRQAEISERLAAEADALGLGAERAESAAAFAPFESGALTNLPEEAVSPRSMRLQQAGAKRLSKSYKQALDIADRAEAHLAKMTDQAEKLAARVDALDMRKEILGDMSKADKEAYIAARKAERQAYAIERAQAVADREIKLLERIAGEAAAREIKAEGRVANQALRMQRTQRILDRSIEQRTELRDVWERAKMAAAQTPEGRAQVTGFPELQGVDFPASQANVLRRAIKKQQGKELGQPWNVIEAFNAIGRFAGATADFSAMAIQGLLASANRTKEFGKASVTSAKSLFDPLAYGKYANEFNAKAVAEGRPTTMDWAANNARFSSGVPGEFTGGGSRKVIETAERIPVAGKVMSASERAFSVFGDVLRNEINNTVYDIYSDAIRQNPKLLKEITASSNKLSGFTEKRFLGGAGEAFVFAPRYFQSLIETFADAAGGTIPARGAISKVPGLNISPNASISQKEARNAILKLVAVASAMTVAGNAARNKDTDFRPTVNGKDNPNFMRLKDVNGQDISLLGPLDRLFHMAVKIATGDELGAARSILNSPLASTLGDLFAGETLRGEKVGTEASLLENLGYGASKFTAFSIPSYGKAVSQLASGEFGKAATTGAVGAFGLRASERTVRERVDDGLYYKMTPEDQLKGLASQSWREVGRNKDVPENLRKIVGNYQSISEWRDAAYADYYERAKKAGYTDSNAQNWANQKVQSNQIYKFYSTAKNYYESEWIRKNPALAERVLLEDKDILDPRKRRLSPRSEDFQAIQKSLAR